jgi:homoserine dehydrogenase
LADAQALGYAEADPSFDVDGVDAAHKLAILTSLAFGTQVDFDKVHIEGIRHVSAVDIQFAEELGYRIKLLGIARQTDHGVEQRVHPCMVPVATPIATVDDVFNAVVAEGDAVGRSVYEGRGAGAGPTASAVLADILDVAANRRSPTFGIPASQLTPLTAWSMDQYIGAYYIRLMVKDVPGVFADIASALREAEVSMEAILQRGRAPGEVVPVVMTLHETAESSLRDALARVEAIEAVVEPPRVIRIESL